MPLRWHEIAASVAQRRIGRRVIYVPTTSSTNDDAKRLAAAGEQEGTVILTDEQTAGRGRAGKSRWLTPANTSIAFSVILRPRVRPDQLGVLSMVAGLAALDAIHRTTPVSATLKWPNDLLVGNRKLGGILVESALSSSTVAYAVVGIGLNGNLDALSLGPLADNALPPTTLRDAAGHPIDREAVITALLESLDTRYAAIQSAVPPDLTREYRAALSTLGQTIRLATSEGTIEGTAEDVTFTGSLIVRLSSGALRELPHGEVTLRPS